MTVADRLTLVVAIDHAAGVHVDWTTPPPEPPIGRLGDFTVAARTQRQIASTDRGRISEEHVLILEPFLDGEKSIPAMRFKVAADDKSAAARELSTQPLTIQVTSLIPADEAEKAELAPPAPPLAATLATKAARTSRMALIAGATVAILSAFAASAWMLRRRREIAADPVAAATAALAELRAALESAAADPFGPASARMATAASELGAIIRGYLDRALSIAAIGATTAELQPRLVAAGLPAQTREPIDNTLIALEREAFSPNQPRASVLLEHVAAAEQLIRSAPPVTVHPGGGA